MLLWQLCPLIVWSCRQSITLDSAECREAVRAELHITGFSQVFSKSLLSTHFVRGIWLGAFELVMTRVLAPALLELMVWWACPDAELSPPGTCRS